MTLAEELNGILSGSVAGKLLSGLGRRMYFPKGIIAQSAEAKKSATRMNATIGVAYKAGKPMSLPSIRNLLPALEPEEIFPYAPTQGIESLREAWKREIEKKNPDIAGKTFSVPLVVPGLTAGISTLADLFVDPHDVVIIPDLYWDNYPLIFETRCDARIVSFPFFTADRSGMNVAALAEALHRESPRGKLVVLLNFPNNPTGYAPTRKEAELIVSALEETARGGTRLLVILDDAYYGLFYESDTCTRSLFGSLVDLHENLLAVKVDGSTKEHLTWGFRTGFVTFGSKGLTPEQYDALTKKLMGCVRSTVSNSSVVAQSLIARALKSPTIESEQLEAFRILQERYRCVKSAIATKKSSVIEPLPFNSGYFMSFLLKRGKAEDLRKALLSTCGVGTIAMTEKILRIAYSSVDTEKLVELYDLIYSTAEKVL